MLAATIVRQEILHVVTDDTSLPKAERASAFCNVRRTMDVLGVSFEHDLSAFDEEGAEGGEIARL